MQFKYIRVSGAPFERGRHYGAAAAEEIRFGLQIYAPAFSANGLAWDDVRRLAASFASRIEEYDANGLRELEGIAAGADLPVEDIIVLNARTELLYGGASTLTPDEGCTGAIALPEATSQGHVLHGQNWDWRADCLQSTVILHLLPDDGPEILTMVEAGGLARCGISSNGLAITGNFLRTQFDDGRGGVPLSFVRRKILQSASFVDAASAILDTPISFSNNVMLSWAAGEAVNFEKTPVEAFWLTADEGVLVHTNHFVSPGALAKVEDRGLSTSPDSLYRMKRVANALKAERGRLTVEHFKRAFADRFGWPHSVCRPPTVGGVGGAAVSTVATVIMDVTAGELHVAPAPYEDPTYTTYRLESVQ